VLKELRVRLQFIPGNTDTSHRTLKIVIHRADLLLLRESSLLIESQIRFHTNTKMFTFLYLKLISPVGLIFCLCMHGIVSLTRDDAISTISVLKADNSPACVGHVRCSTDEISRRKMICGSSALLFGILNVPSECKASLPRVKVQSEDYGVWSGTSLPILSIDEAAVKSGTSWEMGRWPDPALRRVASKVPPKYLGTKRLSTLASKLKETCNQAGAVGLAAQQCGVDASIVYLTDGNKDILLINPRFVWRSPGKSPRVFSYSIHVFWLNNFCG